MLLLYVQAQGRSPSPLHGLNPWSNQIPGFAAALQRYIKHMQDLGEALLRGIAMGLQLPPDTFLGDFAGQEGSYWVSIIIIITVTGNVGSYHAFE
jgi:isopenicillin N synthase-like dioxygenase